MRGYRIRPFYLPREAGGEKNSFSVKFFLTSCLLSAILIKCLSEGWVHYAVKREIAALRR